MGIKVNLSTQSPVSKEEVYLSYHRHLCNKDTLIKIINDIKGWHECNSETVPSLSEIEAEVRQVFPDFNIYVP